MSTPTTEAPQSPKGSAAIPERLKRATRAARSIELRDGIAHQRTQELLRWSSVRVARSRPRWPWALAGAGLAAAVIFAWLLRPGPQSGPPPAVIQVGPRVAMVPSKTSDFQVVRASEEETVIEVQRGAVTARLWKGSAAHRLVLRARNLEATALGTTYSLIIPEEGAARVVVHEGTVSLKDAHGIRTLKAKPADRTLQASVRLLAQHTPRPRLLNKPEKRVEPQPTRVAEPPPKRPRAPPEKAEPSKVKDVRSSVVLWRQARLNRGRGKYEASLAMLEDLRARADPTWSPLAIVEMIRIYEKLGRPEQVQKRSSEFLKQHRDHNLAPEVRALACRAYAQLGRPAPGGLCAAVPK